jgi:uncharacterized protein (TIGR02217 family)
MTLPLYPALIGLTYGNTKTPVWQTRVLTAVSGKEQRASNWTYPRWKFQLTYSVLKTTRIPVGGTYNELDTLMGFCNQMQGQLLPFLFDDTTDDTVVGQPIGIGDGTTTAFPIVRNKGGFIEPILATNNVSTVYINGGVQTLGTNYTLSSVNGYGNDTINFAVAPLSGQVITVDFTFYFVCRFDADETEFSQQFAIFFEAKKLSFISVK